MAKNLFMQFEDGVTPPGQVRDLGKFQHGRAEPRRVRQRHRGGLIDMGFEKIFKQVISMILTACVILVSPGLALPETTTSTTTPQAPSATPSKVLPPGGGPWPRPETHQGARISIYQAQIESWTGNKLDAYTSVTIMPKDSKTVRKRRGLRHSRATASGPSQMISDNGRTGSCCKSCGCRGELNAP